MKKIPVRPEGREGVWLVENAEIADWLEDYPEPTIHNFLNGAVIIGADWDTSSVCAEVRKPNARCAILTGDAQRGNLRHALAVIVDERLKMFDIGPITEAELEILP